MAQKKSQKTINGLNDRYVAQIIRRKMIQKTEPNSKAYKRDKNKKWKTDLDRSSCFL
jgi:hypothetical protein